MKPLDILALFILALVLIFAIIYQIGIHDDLTVKDCVKQSMTDSQLAACVRNIK